jgi:hypothetical protein
VVLATRLFTMVKQSGNRGLTHHHAPSARLDECSTAAGLTQHVDCNDNANANVNATAHAALCVVCQCVMFDQNLASSYSF